MFYSTELLRRKSPLGPVWIVAHGRKLPRGQIMKVNVTDTVKYILDPEVPQALRLQAILASGVCIVHEKQSEYLLEDCEHALKRLSSAENREAQAAEIDLQLERMPDINMKGDIDVRIRPLELFPKFSIKMKAASQPSDLFVMPSIPDTIDDILTENHHDRSVFNLHEPEQDLFFINAEIMDVPDLPRGAFDMDNILDPLGDPLIGQNHGTEIMELQEANAKKGLSVKRRRRKAIIDDLNSMTIPVEEYASNVHGMHGRRDHRCPVQFSDLGPATGPWPASVSNVWHIITGAGMKKRPQPIDTPPMQDTEQRSSKRGRLGVGCIDEVNYAVVPDVEGLVHDTFQQDDVYGMNFADAMDGFWRNDRRETVSDSGDVQTERLRAALNGTPGDGNFPMGFTPSDTVGASTHRRAGRASEDSSHVLGGRLAERSSDRGRDSRSLSDMLREIQQNPETDFAEMLPLLRNTTEGVKEAGMGEEDVFINPSQFSLLEQTEPSIGDGLLQAPSGQAKNVQTRIVLRALQERAGGSETISLFTATAILSRREAAKLFFHVLVGRADSMIKVHQESPFSDIVMTFPERLETGSY